MSKFYFHFLVHGAFGAALMVVFGWIAGVSIPLWQVIAWGCVGMLPDIPYGPWYTWAHSISGIRYLGWIPPIGAHVGLVDPIYHEEAQRTGNGWWNRYWYIELSLWAVSAVILTIRFA